jgi:hypothetical protein
MDISEQIKILNMLEVLIKNHHIGTRKYPLEIFPAI